MRVFASPEEILSRKLIICWTRYLREKTPEARKDWDDICREYRELKEKHIKESA